MAGTPVSRVVDRFLRHLAVERGRSRLTVAAYERDLGRYAAFLADRGRQSIGDVAREDVDAFALALRTGPAPLAASSTARTLSAVRGLHRFAVDEGDAAADPAAEVRPPKSARRLPKAITVEEVTALLTAVSGDEPAALRDRALLELLYATGARVSEAVGLDVDDVQPALEASDGIPVIRLTGKGSKQRLVPVGRHARQALEAYLVRARPALVQARTGSADHAALFVGMRGRRLGRQHVWLIIRAAGERAGLDPARLSPHVLRHSFATHLLQGGADVRVVQELLGHASVATTQLYTKVTADALRDAVLAAHPRAR